MRGRRQGLGNYTLGDRYVTPERRLSQMLTQQGSRGGPSGSWQETLGRIAQQLSGAYIGKLDQDKQDLANQTFAKVERDSFRPPTDAEAMAAPGMRDLELAAMSGMAGDGQGQTVTAPLPDDQLMGQGNIPDIMEKIGRYNQHMGEPGALGDEILQQGLDLQSQKFNQEMNQSREASNVPRPRDFKAELAQGMQGYQQDPNNRIMNEKKPQLEYAMQNLRGLENNPYAQRLLQGLMMNQMDTNAASRLAGTAREQQLADIQSGRDYTSSENQLNRQGKIDAVTARPPVPGRDVPLPEDVQDQKIKQRQAGRNFESPLNTEKRIKLEKENQNYLTPAQKQVDLVFAKDYSANYVSGGAADARKGLSQLTDVIGRLEKGEENLSGPIMGNMPDLYNSMANPNMIDVKETISEVVQRNLRVILGAAFTAKEGEGLIARAYNPALDEKINATRVRRLMTAMEQALDAKDKAAQYYEDNGTMNGFKGTANFSMSDFNNVLDPKNKGRRSGEPNNGSPEGFTDSEWGRLTPEEQAEYNGGS